MKVFGGGGKFTLLILLRIKDINFKIMNLLTDKFINYFVIDQLIINWIVMYLFLLFMIFYRLLVTSSIYTFRNKMRSNTQKQLAEFIIFISICPNPSKQLLKGRTSSALMHRIEKYIHILS